MRPARRVGPASASGRCAVAALVAVAVAGCAASPGARSVPPPGPTPWALPEAALGTQRLLRLDYDGPEGDGSMRLTLRLASPSAFQLLATDRFGRALWSVDVDGESVLWIDHRRETYCRRPPDAVLPGWDEGPAGALRWIPAILLGAVPASVVESRRGGDGEELELEDDRGRRWTATVESGALTAWTLWDDGGPAWWWRRDGRGGTLSQREAGRQLSWREAVVERLAGPLEPIERPAGHDEVCDGP